MDDDPPVIEHVELSGSYTRRRVDQGGWVGAFAFLVSTVRDVSPVRRFEWRVNGQVADSDAAFHRIPGNLRAPTAEVSLQVRDALGQTSSKSFVVHIDTAGPAMTVYPAQRALFRGSSFRTWATVTDPRGIAYTTVQSPGDYPTGVRATSFRLAAGRDRARTVSWLSVDKLGNPTIIDRTVTVDNTAPKVSYKKAPKNNKKLKAKTKLTATASDRNGIARVQLLVNGKVVATDTKAAYSFTLNPKKYGKRLSVQLRAYDKAGNVKYGTKRKYRR